MRKKIFLLLLLNGILFCVILFLLNKIGAIEISFLQPHNKPVSEKLSTDPFLLEKEALKKQWAVLSAKETDLEKKQSTLDKNSQELQEKQIEVNKQLENIENNKKQTQSTADSAKQDEESIRSIAAKVNNIPPESGAAILNDMDSVVAVETIKMMDKMAEENGKQSTTAYLISLMDPTKRKEVVRLMSAYPTSLGNLNTVPTPDDPIAEQ